MILPVFFLPAQAIDLAVSGAGNLENRAPAVLLAPLIEKFIFQDRFALSGFSIVFLDLRDDRIFLLAGDVANEFRCRQLAEVDQRGHVFPLRHNAKLFILRINPNQIVDIGAASIRTAIPSVKISPVHENRIPAGGGRIGDLADLCGLLRFAIINRKTGNVGILLSIQPCICLLYTSDAADE